MRKRVLLFVKLFLFWMLVMSVCRAFFLTYNYDYTANLTIKEVAMAMLFGMPMDMSINGYAVGVSGLLLALSCVFHGRWLYYAVNGLNLIVLILVTLVVMVDVELYRHWGFRMNNTPLFYMGSEAVGSVNPWVAIKLIVSGIAVMAGLIWFYLKWIAPSIWNLKSALQKSSALVLLILSSTMILCIRGSFSTATMNTGFVYFHPTKMYANHAAINVVWNFLRSLGSSVQVTYPEDFLDKDLTAKLFTELHPKGDSTFRIFTTNRPNVILIMVESYTAGVMEVLGGVKGITPRLNELSKDGILFDNFYASATRTDKGLVSILSSYPSQPNSIIIKYPHKIQNLPSLNRSMRALGYKSSFVYGGDADFAYFRSYILSSSFEALTEDEDFDRDLSTSKWGVHDGFVLQRALEELDTTTSPYFKVILTQSSHEPYDVPMKPLLPAVNDENRFLNSCHYTDSCLGAFIDELKKRNDWDNTVVLLTADHGHRFPHDKKLDQKERFHIPFMILGGAVKADTVIHTLGNQTDITNTLLAQLDKPNEAFVFSRDLFSSSLHEHSAFFFTDGFGFIMPGKFMVYDNVAGKFIKEENVTEQDKAYGKAYQQKLYSDFNKR